MVFNFSKLDEVNVLASGANWAWPTALQDIFEPRSVHLLVAGSPGEFVNVIEHKRIHATIIDMDCEKSNQLTTVKIIRASYPMLPCLMLTSHACETMLDKALELDVFSVIDKPVDMDVLQGQLNRLFQKKYNSDVFRM